MIIGRKLDGFIILTTRAPNIEKIKALPAVNKTYFQAIGTFRAYCKVATEVPETEINLLVPSKLTIGWVGRNINKAGS
jgi:hypothetical protein